MAHDYEALRTALYAHFEQVAATPATNWRDNLRKAFAMSVTAVPLLMIERKSSGYAVYEPDASYDGPGFLRNHTAEALKASLNIKPLHPKIEARMKNARLHMNKDKTALVIDDPLLRFAMKHPAFMRVLKF